MGCGKSKETSQLSDTPPEGFLTREEINAIFDAKDYNIVKKHGKVNGICKSLGTSVEGGIDDTNTTDIEARKSYYGANVYPSPPAKSFFELYIGGFDDLAVQILSGAAVVALVGGIIQETTGGEKNGWIDGVAILVAVLLVTIVGAWNDWNKDRQFQALRDSSSEKEEFRVLRNDVDSKHLVSEIIVGDILPLYAGDKIPADGLFIPVGEAVAVDESAMTGEPDHKAKDERHPFLQAGTYVTKGAGKMLVMRVGEQSEWGQLLKNLQPNEDNTPLQDKLEDVVVAIGKVGVVVAVIVFVVLLGYWIDDFAVGPPYTIVSPCDPNKNVTSEPPKGTANEPCYRNYIGVIYPFQGDTGRQEINSLTSFAPANLLKVLNGFIVAVTIVVVAVPEGLPLAVVISLAYSVRQMTKDQNLVRHLQACEIMGGATDICSDKTGTLTENRMAVVQGWIAGQDFAKVSAIECKKPVKSLLIEGLCVNTNDGRLVRREDAPSEGDILSSDALSTFKFVGSTTECALLVLAARLGGDYEGLQNNSKRAYRWNFTSARKRMSSVVDLSSKKKKKYRLHCKGASEMVLKLCTHTLNQEGKVTKLAKKEKKKLGTAIEKLASQGLRTIGLAYRDFDDDQKWSSDEDGDHFEAGLTLISLVGIEDPLRPEVPDSVRTCQRAGITVRMVTGDNVLTAKKIAEDCHIYDPEVGIALEGPEFAEMSDDKVLDMIEGLQILARSKPNDKHRLVSLLQQKGHIVSVTGDGTNDGPALSKADVGLAMGIAGTEVAREAADIIILDDNFASIVKSVLWGRCVFDNIRKFLQFQLTVNIVALTVALIGAISRRGTPISPIQLLWVNLIMDTLGALALGTERPTDNLLRRKPYGREGKLITWTMWRNIFGQSIYQCIVLFTLLFATDGTHHLIFPEMRDGVQDNLNHLANEHYTMIFCAFVWMQVTNEINSRKVGANEYNPFGQIFQNWIFSFIIIVIILIQFAVVYIPGVNDAVFLLVPLRWDYQLIAIAIGMFSIITGTLLRLIKVPLEPWEVPVAENDFSAGVIPASDTTVQD